VAQISNLQSGQLMQHNLQIDQDILDYETLNNACVGGV
jgi:hypothetical protein